LTLRLTSVTGLNCNSVFLPSVVYALAPVLLMPI